MPQCGFSAIASNFYASRVISLGTLMAVFLATSDEAVPLLVSMPAYWDKLVLLMVIKVLYAIAVGLVLDFVLRSRSADGLNCIRHNFRQPCRKVKLRPGRSRCFRTSWAWPPGLQLPFCWDESAQKERTRMEIDLIFKIAAIGIIVAVLNQLLIRSGREDQAMMTTLAGLVVVLSILVKQISVLFVTIKSLFAL